MLKKIIKRITLFTCLLVILSSTLGMPFLPEPKVHALTDDWTSFNTASPADYRWSYRTWRLDGKLYLGVCGANKNNEQNGVCFATYKATEKNVFLEMIPIPYNASSEDELGGDDLIGAVGTAFILEPEDDSDKTLDQIEVQASGQFIVVAVGNTKIAEDFIYNDPDGGSDDNPDEEPQKVTDIKGVFNSNSSVVTWCQAAVDSELNLNGTLAVIPYTSLADELATWLAGSGSGPLNISGGGTTASFSATVASKLKECLVAGYGQPLATILAVSIPEPPPPDDGSDESDEEVDGEECYDGDNGKSTFGIVTAIVGDPMRWITCEISQWIGTAIDGLNTAIRSLLEFNPTHNPTQVEDGENTLQVSWGRILRIANILFVIAFLVMIISTALDLGIFSNYTVKKLLPRIIIAALLANLSWGITTVGIQVTNAIGGATQTIILSPLGKVDDVKNISTGDYLQRAATRGDDGSAGALQAGVVIGLGTLIYYTFASAGAILLPLIATAFIAVLIAFGALLLRRIILVLLIIFAPLAFALWALPGGDKLFHRWWKLFMQMLIMYPMIMALFASGIFVSQLMISTKDQTGLGALTSIAAFAAIVLPYLLIPTLFKLAGGFLGNITGMINDRGKGLIDRSKKWRDEGSQYGRRKQLKAQRKNFTGHEKLLHSMDAEKLAGSRFLASRRRAMGLGRAWAQGDMAKETQRSFLAKTKAAVSKEQLEAASYLSRAVAGGIDSKGIDGKGRKFLVTRKDGTSFMTGKDAAVAEAWLGGKVEALEESLDSNGKIQYGKSAGTLFDGSEAAQRAAGQLAGSQALTPVIDTVRGGGTFDSHGWKRYDKNGNEITKTIKDSNGNDVQVSDYDISSLYTQYRNAADGSEAQHAAAGANMVLAEVKDGYAQNLSGKMPSFVKGENLAFQGIQAGSLAGFHENEVGRMAQYVNTLHSEGRHDEANATMVRIGQAVKQITGDPAKYNMSPVALARLSEAWNQGLAVTDENGKARVDKNGQVIRSAALKNLAPAWNPNQPDVGFDRQMTEAMDALKADGTIRF